MKSAARKNPHRYRISKRCLALEQLECRRVLATVAWDGGGDGVSWSDALNWDTDQLPANGDEVIIDVVGQDPIIEYTGGSVTLASMTSNESLDMISGTIALTGIGQINADLTMGAASLIADGASASITAASSTSLFQGTLRALNGATITVPATSYAEGNSTLEASGTGSVLDLSTVTTLSGGGFIRTLLIRANNGGVVDLSGMTEITGGATQMIAEDAGSRIDASALATFTDTNGNRASLISATDQAEVTAPLLTELTAVNVTVDASGMLPTSQVTNYVGGRMEFSGQHADLSSITELTNSALVLSGGATADISNASMINGATFEVYDGVTLSVPATTYAGQSNSGTLFRASGVGSRLDVSALTTLDGGSFVSTHFVEALDGGTIDFAGLTEVIGGATNVRAEGTSSTIDFPLLTSFTDDNGNRESVLHPLNGGIIQAPLLSDVVATRISLDGTGTMPTSQIASTNFANFDLQNTFVDLTSLVDMSNTRLELRGGATTDLSNATSIDGSSFIVNDGVTLAIPGGTSYVGQSNNSTFFEANGAGSRLDLSALTNVQGGSFIAALLINADDGGIVDLSGTPGIVGGATRITADGGTVELTGASEFTDTNGNVSSWIQSRNGGLVDFGSNSVPLSAVTLTISETGSIQATTVELVGSALMDGTGQLDANLINSALVRPGASPGKITINGDYTQTPDGELELELGGLAPISEHDVFEVLGNASLDGTLDVRLINGLVPDERDAFQILQYATRSGNFATIQGGALASGLVLDPRFAATAATLNAYPELTLSDATIAEGDGGTSALVFDLHLSTAVGYDLATDFVTGDDFASAGIDYVARADTLMIPAGATTATIEVDILGDIGLERDETFFLNLVNPGEVALGNTNAIGRILNDDALPGVTIDSFTGFEPINGTNQFLFDVTLSAPAPDPVEVSFGTADGTALAGSDFSATSGTLNFEASATRGLVSDGSDGPFEPTSHTTVMLPADGVLNYSHVNIPSNVTVTFVRNAANTPAIMLSQGDFIVDGNIQLSAVGIDAGPGGGDGGMLGLGIVDGTDGLGISPGTGGGAMSGFVGSPGGGGGLATAGLDPTNRPGPLPGSAGIAVPFPEELGERGGSGGGGGGGWERFGDLAGANGGGGGGGFVAASSHGAMIINGNIFANGANGGTAFANAFGWGGAGGGGSGGVIDLQADRIEITGMLQAIGGEGGGIGTIQPGNPDFSSGAHGGLGYIRLTTPDLSMNGTVEGELITRDYDVRRTIAVDVSSDAIVELPETYSVELSNPVDAVLLDANATGTILQPGDFDSDADFDGNDIDALVAGIASGAAGAQFDLNGDGNVDLLDRDLWLALAGEANLGPGRAYLVGDANLDGVVDGLDFIEWNNNKFTSVPAWTAGDFNADGFVDGLDFIEWNTNKFQTADSLELQPHFEIDRSRLAETRRS